MKIKIKCSSCNGCGHQYLGYGNVGDCETCEGEGFLEKETKNHQLKIHPIHFRAVKNENEMCRKTVEIRKNDRDYSVHDILTLKEFDPQYQHYSGKSIDVIVTHILTGSPYVPDGYIALSILIFEDTLK